MGIAQLQDDGVIFMWVTGRLWPSWVASAVMFLSCLCMSKTLLLRVRATARHALRLNLGTDARLLWKAVLRACSHSHNRFLHLAVLMCLPVCLSVSVCICVCRRHQAVRWSLGVSCCTSGATSAWTSSYGSRPTACGASSSQAGRGIGSTTARSTAWWATRAGQQSTGGW